MKKFSALSTFQLRYLLKKMKTSISTYVGAIDQLKLIQKNQFAAIINNEKSNEPGMHWIALYKSSPRSNVEIFDSFALPLSFYGSELQKFAKRFKVGIRKNTFQIQSFRLVLCGYISIFFLSMRIKGYSFDKIVDMFKPNRLNRNEKIVKAFFKNISFPKLSMCTTKCFKECKMEKNDISSVCVQKNRRCEKQ